MCNWIISEYKKYKLGDLSTKDQIYQLWPEAFNTLDNNQSLLNLVVNENVLMCKEAVERYNSIIVS